MNKKERVTYYIQLYYDRLNEIICEWDPYGLSQEGNIIDEFSGEVKEILSGLREDIGSDEIINLVSKVFSQSFCSKEFNEESCREVGLKIFEWWRQKR